MILWGHKIRLIIVMCVILLLFTGIVIRFHQLQIIKHDFFVSYAEKRHTKNLKLYPQRGVIFDRTGKKILANTRRTKSVFVNPSIINNPEKTKDIKIIINYLSETLNLDPDIVTKRISAKTANGKFAGEVMLLRKPTDKQLSRLEEFLKDSSYFLPEEANSKNKKENFLYGGIYFKDRDERIYPAGKTLCHTIGFMKDEDPPGILLIRDDINPQRGLELSFNDFLSGKEGWRIAEIDKRRIEVVSHETRESPAVNGYNLILSTIFALGITQTFSLIFNILNLFNLNKVKKVNLFKNLAIGIIGAFIVNLGGNLHTIYILTKGYPNENPLPFWQILSFCNTLFPKICEKIGDQLIPYWYPNATRFIPYTIHEFPSYSYVVADLHGHVFDIPFVLLTLTVLFLIFISKKTKMSSPQFNFSQLLSIIFLGFLTAVHYMTNAFDGPIYFLLSIAIFFLFFGLSFNFIFSLMIITFSFFLFSFPFSFFFKPFVSGIGVNCGEQIFSFTGKFGPFLFEKNNCQLSPLWMLFLLWGFFWISFLFFILIGKEKLNLKNLKINQINYHVFNFIFLNRKILFISLSLFSFHVILWNFAHHYHHCFLQQKG